MTPLCQRMFEDMRIRSFATTTQRRYVHYVAEFAKYFHCHSAQLDREAPMPYNLRLPPHRQYSHHDGQCVRN